MSKLQSSSNSDFRPDRLLRWYAENRRALPWRDSPTFYRVWISEVMLQQTRVETVIAYFERFLRRFPTLSSLAEADLQDVLKLWEGLGYYSRARNLHKAAQIIRHEHKGNPPTTASDLLALPGFGEYTAAAVASIVYGDPVPVIDGNVLRVMGRFLAIDTPIRKQAARRSILHALQGPIGEHSPGDFNQALMELGARVCLAGHPRCEQCPLNSDCRALAEGRTRDLPVRDPRKVIPHHNIAVAVIEDKRRRILIQRRSVDSMLGGLWEFPGGKQRSDETLEQTAIRETREETGLDIVLDAHLVTVKHAYSHFRITLAAFRAHPVGGTLDPQPSGMPLLWVERDELRDYPFPKANLAIIEALQR